MVESRVRCVLSRRHALISKLDDKEPELDGISRATSKSFRDRWLNPGLDEFYQGDIL